jgi:hypothetical protein
MLQPLPYARLLVAGYIPSESKLPDQDWAVCSKALHLVGNIDKPILRTGELPLACVSSKSPVAAGSSRRSHALAEAGLEVESK